jgi:hypothetical protein
MSASFCIPAISTLYTVVYTRVFLMQAFESACDVGSLKKIRSVIVVIIYLC